MQLSRVVTRFLSNSFSFPWHLPICDLPTCNLPIGGLAIGRLLCPVVAPHILGEELTQLQQVVGGHQPDLTTLIPRLHKKEANQDRLITQFQIGTGTYPVIRIILIQIQIFTDPDPDRTLIRIRI